LKILKHLPAASMDCCMTSPPYWGKRQYAEAGIGLEPDYREYLTALLAVFAEVKRVLKPSGSLWLNLGDSYADKKLLGLP
jgi:DNA modification methylase